MGRSKTFLEFQEFVFQKLGKDYIVKDYVVGKYNHSIITHIQCGNDYSVAYQMIAQANETNKKARCPFCFPSKYDKNTVQNEINRIVGNTDYKVIEYKNKREPIKLYHEKCNNFIQLYLGNIQKGQRCKICECGYSRISDANGYNTDSFSEKVSSITKNTISLVGSYINYLTPVSFKCNTCNNIFQLTPQNFIRGTRCPFCKASSGEQQIIQFLKANNIQFEFQKQIIINEHTFKLDFYIKEKNIAIEFDGKQHFKPGFGENLQESIKVLEYNKKRDKLKDEYCNLNNIHLIRISYLQIKEISKILKNVLQLNDYNQ